jgi:phosphate/sulfate permease
VSQPPQSGSGKGSPADLDTAIAGGSVGAFLAALAASLPESWYKTVLGIASPIVAVAISTGVAAGRRWYTRRLNDRRATAALAMAEEKLLETINDDGASEERKEKARKDLEELRQLDIDTHIEEARSRMRKRYNEE